MPYLSDYVTTCKSRATNPHYPLELLDSIRKEFDKGLNGGIFDATYVLAKIDTLRSHVSWCEQMAVKEFEADCEEEEEEDPIPMSRRPGSPEVDDDSDLTNEFEARFS